jgi:16S rRNA (guanine966-N2)-methyltransferase
MRIIAGEFRSRLLEAPRGMETRPTSDRLRETLFNVLQPRLPGARFLDLYAGSGANGLEALSRGAAEAVLVEQASPALAAIRKNIATLGIAANARVEGIAVGRWLANRVRDRGASLGPGASLSPGHIAGESKDSAPTTSGRLSSVAPGSTVPFDVIFLDPPYDEAEAYSQTLNLLGGEARALLAPDALVVAEHRRQRGGRPLGPPAARLANAYGPLHRIRLLEQGDAALSFYAL